MSVPPGGDVVHSTPSTMYDNKRFIERGSHKGKGLAVFTSGGDSQGIVVNIYGFICAVKSQMFPVKIQ
jgi:hypothetical protein